MNGNDNQPTTGTPVDAESAIQEALARIQSIYELVPDFQKTPPEGFSGLTAARTLSDQFLEASASTLDADGNIQTASTVDPAATRLVITRNLRFETLAVAAEALARDVRYTMFRERWNVAKDALHVYDLSKVFSRKTRGVALVPHVRAMRNALGRRNTRAKTQEPQPEPQSTPKPE
jgi:hypothetical protein